MSKNITTTHCEVCGRLFPLKLIHARRDQHCAKSNGEKDAHHSQMEQGSMNENGCLEECLLLSNDSKIEESSGKMRSYNSVLEEIQAIFANHKVKQETISSYVHQVYKHKEWNPNKPKQHKQSQAHQHAVCRSKHKFSSKSLSPINVPCFCHALQDRYNINKVAHKNSIASQRNESTCKRLVVDYNKFEPISITGQSDELSSVRIIGQVPQDDASNCNFDPLRIWTSPQIHVAHCSTHHLSEHSTRRQAQKKATTRSSFPCKTHHGAIDNHQDVAFCSTLENLVEQNVQPMMDNDCNHDVLQLHKQCQLHQIDEHMTTTLITSSRENARRSQGHVCEQAKLLPQQPQQSMYNCHQNFVVQHHKGCHLHPRDNHDSLAISNQKTRNPRQCKRCGCIEGDYCNPKEALSPPDLIEHPKCKAYIKTTRSPPHIVKACTQRLSPRCKMHGDCTKVDVCELCCHPKNDHMDQQKKDCDIDARKENIEGCHLHSLPNLECQEQKNTTKPKCQDVVIFRCQDPLVWAPKQVQKPKPCSSLHWLDQIVASQKFPSHIIQQFLQGKRKCPPQVKKPQCLACLAKCMKALPHKSPIALNMDLCEHEVGMPWNLGSNIAIGIECKEPKRGKLSRLVLSRTLIIKPVVKLSIPPGPWTTRKEFQVCSECRDPLALKSGRWKSVLEEMSGIPKKCSPRFSCQTIHGLVLPSDIGTQAIDLHCPKLNSALHLHSKLQKVQIETFDRGAALQIAQTKGIEFDKEIFDQLLPKLKKPKKVSSSRSSKQSVRNYICKQQQREVYRDLCKIVDPPTPIYPIKECLVRDAGVQIGNTSQPLEDIYKWKSSGFGAKPYLHSDQARQSSAKPCTPNPNYPTCWLEQEQPHYQGLEKSWDEQHWADLVEACKQARMEQGVSGNCAAC